MRQRLDGALDHDRKGPRGRDRLGVGEYALGLRVRFALRPKAAQRVDGLRHQPDVPQNRNAPLDQKPHRLSHLDAALQLDTGAACFGHHAGRAAKRLRRRFLIRPEGQIDDDASLLGAAHDGGTMRDHHLERDADGALESVEDHAE